MPPPSVGDVAFSLVRTRCFTARPHLGVGASLVEEEEEREEGEGGHPDVTCQHTRTHLYSSAPAGKSGANMPAT